ncbi:aspartyl protease family protein [Flectobacillus longus]|uniref:aspartyl protease family protein n=1 Tax=Flectobacillus longus TaxID=2984207 RepID=UPI0024B7D87B|nr:aspartyl protease family protein [Flectobacillus longus]MDI9881371.1 aspartyl protease family protein [Flectobacillus longus]
MLRKLIGILGISAFCPLYAQTIPERVEALIMAINQKNVPLLLTMVDDSCTIANLPKGQNAIILPAILEKYVAIASYKIVSQEANGVLTKVQLDVKYQDNKEGHPYFVFGKEKVKELGIIKSARIPEPEMPILAGIFPEKVTLPFNMRNGLIFIEAELNGQKGYFQLDSGCPVVILNRQYASKIQGNPFTSFSGLNGSMKDVRLSNVDNLKIGTIEISNKTLVSSPMEKSEFPFLGLLGYEWMKDYVVTFDYKNQLLTLEKSPKLTKALLSIPFSQERHIPIIPLTIHGKTYQLGIDCGANANVIYQPYSSAISPLLEEVMTENVGGAEGSTQKSITGYLPEAKLESLLFKDMFMAMTENKINVDASHQLPIQGLLGTPFLQLYKTVINFPTKTIAFYNN